MLSNPPLGAANLLCSIAQAYPENVVDINSAFATLKSLNEALLVASDRERRVYGSANRLFRWPRFEVMEILANEEVGLYGYRVYFSNGSHAQYSRTIHQTEALNISFQRDGQVNYFVGSFNDMRKEWRVGSKRLFEVGLRGKYNANGEWKPLIYEGPTEVIREEVLQLTNDRDVEGLLFEPSGSASASPVIS